MRDPKAIVEQYVASWNEIDDARRDALVAATFTEDVVYTDPLMRGSGHAAVAGLIRGVQTRFPGFRFTLTRGAERVDDHVRFSWELGPVDAAAPVAGTDFARVAADGRLSLVHGFLDRVPTDAVDAAAAGTTP